MCVYVCMYVVCMYVYTCVCICVYVHRSNQFYVCVNIACSLASTASTHSGDDTGAKPRSHTAAGRSGSITINVRMSSSSVSSLSKDSSTAKPRMSVTSKTSSDVPSITVDASSPDLTTHSTSSLCEILPDDSKLYLYVHV